LFEFVTLIIILTADSDNGITGAKWTRALADDDKDNAVEGKDVVDEGKDLAGANKHSASAHFCTALQ
jgi:hypothetical protein